jgi:hypothetical protein
VPLHSCVLAINEENLGPVNPRRGARVQSPHDWHCTGTGAQWWPPNFDSNQFAMVRDLLARDASPTAIEEAVGVSRQMLYRVQDDPVKAEAMLAEWGM